MSKLQTLFDLSYDNDLWNYLDRIEDAAVTGKFEGVDAACLLHLTNLHDAIVRTLKNRTLHARSLKAVLDRRAAHAEAAAKSGG